MTGGGTLPADVPADFRTWLRADGTRRLCPARPTSERGFIHAMAYVWTDEKGRNEDGVALKVGPSWLPGKFVQWFTVERARALAAQINAACDAAESGTAPRTPRPRRSALAVPHGQRQQRTNGSNRKGQP